MCLEMYTLKTFLVQKIVTCSDFIQFKECMDYMNTILFVFLRKTLEEIGALKLCSSLKNVCGYCFHGSLVKLKQVVYDIVLVVFVSKQLYVPELHFDDLGGGGTMKLYAG